MIDLAQPDIATAPVSIEEKLEETRRRLLDLTRRNRLLNHRGKGRSALRIVDELPEEIFRLLVTEGRTLQFLAREEAPPEARAVVDAEAAKEAAEERGRSPAKSYQTLDLALAPIALDGSPAARHADHNLQTVLDGEKLQAQLLHLARESASARLEQGTNTLYLTLGIVEWREVEQGPTSRAPLVFVPVDLDRRNVQSRYSLKLFEDEVVTNPCLVELCKRTFGFDLPRIEGDEPTDLLVYFGQVSAAVSRMRGWRLASEIHLGLFSFSKLLMYRDLDPANWPGGRGLTNHPLVRRLSGFDLDDTGPAVEMPNPATLDDTVRPADTFQVVDADSSQQVAILLAKRGASAVIEGPPGTGKSQTITNIIAECLSVGKTVLFVAEKSAALSVVKRRLEGAGLGDFVLELHSHKASKKAVLDELQRTLKAYEGVSQTREADTQELQTTRSRLNAYARDLHQPLGALGLSPFAALSRAIAVADAPEANCQIADPLAWSPAQLSEALEQLSALDRWRARVGDETAHPWRGIGLTSFDLPTRQRVQRSLQALIDALRLLEGAAQTLARHMLVEQPPTPAAMAEMVTRAHALLDAPRLSVAMVSDPGWDGLAPDLAQWLADGAERERHKAIWSRFVGAAAEREDWGPILQRRKVHNQSPLGWLVPSVVQDYAMRWLQQSWVDDANALERHLLPGVKPTLAEQYDLLQALVASGVLRSSLLAGTPQFADQFGEYWRGIDGDWGQLRQIAEGAVAVRTLIRHRAVHPAAARRIVSGVERDECARAVVALEQALAQVEQAWADWCAATTTGMRRWLPNEWQTIPLVDQRAQIDPLTTELERLEDWVQLQECVRDISNGPLASFVGWALSPAGQTAAGRLAQTFARQFYQLYVDAAMRERPGLRSFRGEEHETLIGRFRAADLRWIETNRKRVSGRIRADRPDFSGMPHRQSKLGIVKAEMRKKRRHMPLRKLFGSAGDVIQSIKPCLMMSPISIAQYLPPGAVAFDVVIFDEASQVEPADAYGAIARGKQLILVGDEKQLPPTNFFNKIEAEDDGTDDDELAVGDLESILALGTVRLRHQCALRWHYRSRHAALIEFSNQQFYDGHLRVFPGPHTRSDEYGLVFRHVDGIYMRGAGQHNPIEAHAVAQEVIHHAFATPKRSLGVGAFSVSQQRAIEDEIERLRRTAKDPRVEAFFQAHPHEPFFVKNLETIQGDERDVILLSVGYGRDQHGKLAMNFGPLNREGGWRRLNVLVTRARERCVLFSSIRAADMNLGATSARGVRALKEYLHLAEHGRVSGVLTPSGDHDSPFEAEVCRALRDHGWEVHAQVGSAGFFVDLAVVDPEQPGRYLLGIECDGATYHSSPTARDRDRLRQQILEDLGWAIARIWSTDWYRRPEQTLSRVLEQLASLRGGAAVLPPQERVIEEGVADLVSVPAQDAAPIPDPVELGEGLVVQPYVAASLRGGKSQKTLLEIPPGVLANIVTRVVQTEAPIHVDEVRRVIASFFANRASKRVQEQIDVGIQAALAQGQVVQRGAFLWLPGVATPPVRVRGDDCPVVDPDLIAPEELQEAVKLVLARAFGLRQDALISSTCRLLGFRRCGANLEAAIGAAIEQLQAQGAITQDAEGFLILRRAGT